MDERDNFVYLTFALILLLLSTAAAQQFFDQSMQRLVQSTTVMTLLVAVWGVKSKNFILRKAFIFPVAILLVALFSNWLDDAGFDQFYLLLLLSFFISTAIKTARQVLFTGDIDGNKILGAICLYLLMGLIWAVLYTLLQLEFSGSFPAMSSHSNWFTLFPEFIYFSFVTITTLGFGDISPTLPVARFLVYLEAIVGQFYLAILVASLVGSRMSSLSSHKTK
ncbi:potassium channel family protein [Litorilituus sediminis]|uniref:Two pore domain potassium channel family protein n=1 Tax=Litorilituus sediminis TaxID=718192 RepID=A0A4P6PBQ3_9GAMM|nr:potassium channel family protein [Litorilituus sediminis]QBG37759.1 two pore domain potassium channel family protein [Litorilituus sediminis]